MSEQDNALDAHVVFFDRNRDGVMTREEIRIALEELGFSRLLSRVLAPVLSLTLPNDVDVVRVLRHDDTGSFDREGNFDEDAFAEWFERTDKDGSGDLSRWELLVASKKMTDDPISLVASVAELQLMHRLLAEDGGLSRSAILRFMNGDLFRELMAEREAGG